MSPNLVNVLASVELLNTEERRQLVEFLVEGLDDLPAAGVTEPPVLSEAWRQEVARRSAEYDAGKAETVPWQEVQARWQSRGPADG